MSKPINPYIAGNPVGNSKAFVGRADVLREVQRILERPQENAILLYGQRRIGKTSVLQYLQAQLSQQSGRHSLYFDLQDKAQLSLDQVVCELARYIADCLQIPNPDLGEHAADAFRETWLQEILQALPADESLTLLLDEFDVLADPQGFQAGKEFFPWLRQLIAQDPQRLNFVFVIGRNVNDLDSISKSLFKSVKSYPVSLLNRKDTESLIRLSEVDNSLQWADESIEKIYQLTNGHAYLTQQLCSHVWEDLVDEEQVGVEDIETVIDDTLSASRNMFEWLWDGLPPAGRIVISALAEAGERPITGRKA